MTNVTEGATPKLQLLDEGHRAFDAGDFARALDCYHRACLLDAQDAAVWIALGMAFNNLEFPREAWRSYLLALSLAPDNLDALWYAAEFLAQMEDIELGHTLVQMYLERETDPQRRADAEELRAELEAQALEQGIRLSAAREEAAQQMLGQPDAADNTLAYLERGEDAESTSGAGEGTGDESSDPGETASSGSEGAPEEPSPDEVALSDEELERQALSAARFLAPLQLKMSGFEGLCRHCGLQVPQDAPYCWSCKMIHFYE